MRNTIRKVIIVVPVLMTSCQVSLKPKRGPVQAQPRMRATAPTNVAGRPVARAVHFAKRVNHEVDFVGRIAQLPEGRGMETPPHVVRPLTAEAAVSSDREQADGKRRAKADHREPNNTTWRVIAYKGE